VPRRGKADDLKHVHALQDAQRADVRNGKIARPVQRL
jgi:hypothetical protein